MGNPIRNLFDNLKPLAEKNKVLHTTYDAIETFLFQPNIVTKGKGVHIKDGMDLKRTMVSVVISLQLALVHGIFNIGHQHYLAFDMFPGLTEGLFEKAVYGLIQLLPLIIVVHVVGLGIEFVIAAMKGHQVEEGFLVSGMLIPLIMPPDVPLWMVAVATAFAVIIAKEAFGGTGMNILNVALTARVFLFFAYPGEISGDVVWVSYDYNWIHQLVGLESSHMELKGITAEALNSASKGWQSFTVNGFSGATPLDLAAKGGLNGLTNDKGEFINGILSLKGADGNPVYSLKNMFLGLMPGSVGEMNKLFILIGAAMLLFFRIASWRVMLSMVVGAAIAGFGMNLIADAIYGVEAAEHFIGVPVEYQFVMGGFLFAMAFMATDPVTAASTNKGKLIYGFMIGVLGMIIRVLNPAYPEGWMLAILFMNVFAPLVDHFVLQGNIKRRLSRGV